MAVSKTTPTPIKNYPIQDKAIKIAKSRDYFGLFLDPGMGKSRVDLLLTKYWHEQGLIDAHVVLAKNSGKTNWVIWDHMIENPETDMDAVTKEIPGYPVIKAVWISGATGANKKCWADFEKKINGDVRGKLIIIAINYEALLSEQVMGFLTEFLKKFRTVLTADESTRIGEISSKRTKRAIKLARIATKRLALCGTPVLKSPMKIFAQAKFLDERALGFTNFYPFRNRYAKMGGFEMRQIVAFQNMDELSDKIASFSIRATAEDHLDLPERTWKQHRVYMTPEQTAAYKTMREEFFANVNGVEITAGIVLAQMTRLQQIVGGFLPDGKGGVIEIIPPARNPKVIEALDIIEAAPGQVVGWFRFRPELEAVAAQLRELASAQKKRGEKPTTFYEFHGGITSTTERVQIRKSFQRGERDVVLATASTGGDSIDEFKVANTVFFYSNDYDTEKRVQAERRNWRGGSQMHKLIAYKDIVVPNTVDVKILGVLRNDSKLSAKLLKEQWREWV